MKQQAFEQAHGAFWSDFGAALAALEQPGMGDPLGVSRLPEQYRRICHHLSLARERGYGVALIDRLNGLALRGHQRLYGVRGGTLLSALSFFSDFPSLVRKRWRAVALAGALFYGPAVALTFGAKANPEIAYLTETPDELTSMESMYQSGKTKFGREAAADTDVQMFGLYIWNNVRITFQCFASGLLAGLGPILFLFWNGAHGGAIAGYLTHQGLGMNFWSFVATHSALELNSLVISGAGGLLLGWALLFPGRRGRKQALNLAAKEGLTLVMGAAVMDVGAALFEAFWSSSAAVPPTVKFAVAGGLWTLTLLYFLAVGHRRSAQDA